jgi:hypothetical protein
MENKEVITMESVYKQHSLAMKFVLMAAFMIAMAYLESAVVVYLRRVYGINEIENALAVFDSQISIIEMGRELATMVMLFTAAWMAGRNRQSRFGFFLFTFGVWDILYYIWLKVFIGWPASLLDNDLLFLLPLPWWGPVLAPALIALLMILAGVGLLRLDENDKPVRPGGLDWAMMTTGSLVILYAFMADAINSLPVNIESLALVQPGPFKWSLYLFGILLNLLAIWRCGRKANR